MACFPHGPDAVPEPGRDRVDLTHELPAAHEAVDLGLDVDAPAPRVALRARDHGRYRGRHGQVARVVAVHVEVKRVERWRFRAVEPGLSGASRAARGRLFARRGERYDGEEATATHVYEQQ